MTKALEGTAQQKASLQENRVMGMTGLENNRVAAGHRRDILAAGHHHDGPRTWIRGCMAPRGSKPAGLFLSRGSAG
mgnify:CR=1 FL=1